MTKNQKTFTNTNVSYADTVSEMGLNKNVILKQINFIIGTQDNP